MNGLNYYTRGQTSPQGKVRIYFKAHPDDYNKYQISICKEILDRHNCAIFLAPHKILCK